MAWLSVDANVHVNLDHVVRVEFTAHSSTVLGEEAHLFTINGDRLALVTRVTTIPALQQLRQFLGDGTGRSGWVRARTDSGPGDNEDAYVSFNKVTAVAFTSSPDGTIARLTAGSGIQLGQVHLAAALEKIRELVR